MTKRSSQNTQVVHGGVERIKPNHAITVPITQAATYTFLNHAEYRAHNDRKLNGIDEPFEEYDRIGNPTVKAVEKRLAAIEGGEDALLFASGMAAISTLLLATLPTNSHIILMDHIYWHTQQFCTTFLKRLGIETSLVPMGDYEALQAAIIPKKTRYIVSESPTNPYLRVIDFERLVEIARQHKVRTIIDSTFGTPINQLPLEYGIDYVVHSATKYLGGHHDILGGVVIGNKTRIAALREAQVLLGANLSPHSAYLLERGLKTLALRVQKQNENGLAVAQYLEQQSWIDQVWYPALKTHPDYTIAQKQMAGFGGVISFTLKASTKITSQWIDKLQIPYIATSLGGIESLVEQPGVVLFYEKTEEERQALGMPGNLVRLALGIEDAEDIIADLEQAFSAIG